MSWEAWGDPPEPPEFVQCPMCKGTGRIEHHDGDGMQDDTCDYCQGEGEVYPQDIRFDDDVI